MKKILAIFMTVFLLSACGTTISKKLMLTPSDEKIRRIAVMPVNSETGDVKIADLLRKKVLDELYFKGYPKVPIENIDGKLLSIQSGDKNRVLPEILGQELGVDALMYCTFNVCKTSYRYFYAPTVVSVTFELRNAKTGRTLWCVRCETTERSYGFSQRYLEMKSCQLYESALQDVLEKAMQSLPSGVDLG